MLVGPSMAPITAIDAAWFSGNPKRVARMRVAKMPSWPAAPRSANIGCDSRGRKSIIAPMPMKMKRGKSSVLMPNSIKSCSIPSGWFIGEFGRLPSSTPKPMGSSRVGSYSFAIAR